MNAPLARSSAMLAWILLEYMLQKNGIALI